MRGAVLGIDLETSQLKALIGSGDGKWPESGIGAVGVTGQMQGVVLAAQEALPRLSNGQ